MQLQGFNFFNPHLKIPFHSPNDQLAVKVQPSSSQLEFWQRKEIFRWEQQVSNSLQLDQLKAALKFTGYNIFLALKNLVTETSQLYHRDFSLVSLRKFLNPLHNQPISNKSALAPPKEESRSSKKADAQAQAQAQSRLKYPSWILPLGQVQGGLNARNELPID